MLGLTGTILAYFTLATRLRGSSTLHRVLAASVAHACVITQPEGQQAYSSARGACRVMQRRSPAHLLEMLVMDL